MCWAPSYKENIKRPSWFIIRLICLCLCRKSYASNYGFPMYTEALPDSFLQEGDEILLGSTKGVVLFVPGHAPGSHCFLFWERKESFAGDVLFQSSIGQKLICPVVILIRSIESIHQKLFTLPDDVTVFPGPANYHHRPGKSFQSILCAHPSLTHAETYPQRAYFELIGGSAGIICSFHQSEIPTEWFVWAACVFDFLDGFAARILKVSSSIGKELDSLADMVSFGLLPGIVMKNLLTASGVGVMAQYWTFLTVFLRTSAPSSTLIAGKRFIYWSTYAPHGLFICGIPSLMTAFPPIGSERQLNRYHITFLGAHGVRNPAFALKFKNFTWRITKLVYLSTVRCITHRNFQSAGFTVGHTTVHRVFVSVQI